MYMCTWKAGQGMFRTETKNPPRKTAEIMVSFKSWDDGSTRLEIGGGKAFEEVAKTIRRGGRRRWCVSIYTHIKYSKKWEAKTRGHEEMVWKYLVVERERKRSVKRKNVVSKCGYLNIGVVIATGKANSRPQDWVLKPLDFQDHPLFFSDLLISNNNTSLSIYSPKRHCLRSSFPFLSSFLIF